jgi:V8-like Glu-specific endopeptidase
MNPRLIALLILLAAPLSPQKAFAIVGGEPYTAESYRNSAHVGFQVVWGAMMDVCGGTLLNSTTILTSATCFNRVYTDATTITAFRTMDMNRQRSNQMRISPSQIIRHPDYSASDINSPDFAIVKLARPFADTEHLGYPPLRESVEAEHYGLYGYGRDDNGQMGVLRKNFKTKRDVRDHHDSRLIKFDQSNGGICGGDSGSALWVSFNKQIYLIAIADSMTAGDGKECRGSGYFRKVAPVMDWITAHSGAAPANQTSGTAGTAVADDPKVLGGAFRPQ